MYTAQFLEMLSQEGYPHPVEVHQPPNGSLSEHSHPFAVKALVVEGSIEISTAEHTQSYEVGDIFELADQELHSESYGPHGVCYLASRK